MKKSLLIASSLCIILAAHAEWTTSDTEHTLIGTPGEYGQAVLHSATTPNGSTVVTWLNTPSDLSYDDPDFGFYLYMQIFDAEGNPVFPQEGLKVVNKHTDSWVTDYALTCTENGDILIAYNDMRNGSSHVYAYRYDEQGNPVWDADGVVVSPATTVNEGSDMDAEMVVSGENIYLAYSHTEYWREKATEENWEPSPYFPDEEMPDSVDVSLSVYQLFSLNPADGSPVWDAPLCLNTSTLFLYPAPEGSLYTLYANDICALYAQKVNAEGTYAWDEESVICAQPLSSYGFINSLAVAPDQEGGLAIALNIPNGWYYYTGITHLDADGDTFLEPVCGNVDPSVGNTEMAAITTRDNYIFAAWPYAYSSAENYMWCNLFDASRQGDYAWEGDLKAGLELDVNDMWGMRAVKAIAQQDGWVVIYANCTSWSGANLMIVKVSDQGEEMWRRQVCEPDFKCSRYSVESDGKKALFFYTCDVEYDANWEPVYGEGGMFVMCFDLTNGQDITAIRSLSNDDADCLYDLQGRRIANPQQGKVLISNGKLMVY